MRKLIVFAMFTMFAGAAAAQEPDRGAGAQLEAPVTVAGDVAAEPDLGAAQGPAGEAQPFNDWCYDLYADCTADCLDFVGAAKGACLRLCRFELDECLGN